MLKYLLPDEDWYEQSSTRTFSMAASLEPPNFGYGVRPAGAISPDSRRGTNSARRFRLGSWRATGSPTGRSLTHR